MTEEKQAPIEPVVVAVVADGKNLQAGEIITPGADKPNLVVQAVTPALALFIRFVNVFLPVFSGILTGSLTTDMIPAKDFMELAWKCAGLSLAGTMMSFLKDLITIFGRLETKYPLLTGKV